MKKYLLVLAFFLTACATPAPTPNPAEVGLTMFADRVNAEATQMAVNSVFTATAQVYGLTATVQAAGTQEAVTQQARIDAQATADQNRADVQATADQRRMDAQATQARMDIESTQQAQATANAFAMTQAVAPTHNYWTQQAVEQQIVIGTNAVELSNLEVKQQQQTNTIDWAIPTLGAIGLTITAVVYVLRHSRTREIKNENGDIEMVIFDNAKAIKPALMAKPVLMIEAMTMPDVSSPADQRAVTERAQMIQALAVMPVNTSNAAAGAFNQYFSQAKEQPYDIVDTDALPAGLVDVEALKSMEGDWKEAKGD